MAVPNSGVPVPGFGSETTLPPELRTPEFLSIIKKGVTQWSRIVAWSWCDYLVYEGKAKEAEERKLKACLIEALTQQALEGSAYLSYGDEVSKQKADAWSQTIVKLLLGEKPDGINLSLSELILEITEEELVTSKPENQSFTKLFYAQITTDSFSGQLIHAPKESATPYTPYINIIPYPPRPALGSLTVTEDQLVKWASNHEDFAGDYLPPSVYIPRGTC
ncbi:MAG TPA: hypothetical protein DD379_19265 [Cyanobacteria bacterium UBA11162]|nr:hypothetical protein [Cyanobacteria bacterium UBA11162]